MTDYDIAARPLPPRGLQAVGLAFKRAIVTQCHPKMLLALFLPFFIALLGATVLLWFFWAPLTHWLDTQGLDWAYLNALDQWLLTIGLFSLKLYLVPLLAIAILLPMAGILGLGIAAVFVMPIVLRHLDRRQYAGLARKGEFAVSYGVWNVAWVGALFVVGWLVTMPLWLFPPLAVALPIVWWAFAFMRILRVDSIVEHASSRERKLIWKQHNREYWLMGLILALINLFPPAWLVLPVFSSLLFAHYSLEALRQLRHVDVPAH